MALVTTGNITCVYSADRHRHTIYFIAPQPLEETEVERLAKTYRCNLAVITGINWADDMTPWVAPPVFPEEARFGGNAEAFADRLIGEIIPAIEKDEKFGNTEVRDIAGISLSGLFATYIWLTRPFFDSMASISGSFWYNGFVNFINNIEPVNRTGVAYFSLVVTEANSKVERFKSISGDTAEVIFAMRRYRLRAIMEWNRGGHNYPIIPRLEKALLALTTQNVLPA